MLSTSVPRKLISIRILYEITTLLLFVGALMSQVTNTIFHTSDNKKTNMDNSDTLRIRLIYTDNETNNDIWYFINVCLWTSVKGT